MNRFYTLCLPVTVGAMLLGQISTTWGADQWGRDGRGAAAARSGGPAVSRAAAPAHVAAPRVATPRIAAPRVNTQRFTAPRVSTPRVTAAPRVSTPRSFATTSRNTNRVTPRAAAVSPSIKHNPITNNKSVVNRSTLNRGNRNLALRNNITPNTAAAAANANRANITNRNPNRFGNRNNAAVANRQLATANAVRTANAARTANALRAARAANNARFAAFRYGSFHRNWDPARAYYWNNRHWRCYNGVWAVVDIGWPGDWSGYPYPFAYDNTVYYGGDVYQPEPQPAAIGSSMVADVQADLANMGYNPGPADGVAGPQTSNAIAQYQQDNGLGVTGQIDGPTLDSLGL